MWNLLRLLIASAVLLCLAPSCRTVDSIDQPVVVDDRGNRVGIVFIGKSYDLGVVLRFALYGAEYSHIVQEITLDDGSVLVECFRDDGDTIDRHSWVDRPHYRSMVVYAANCVGVDERYGFGHLPDNGNGLSTTVGSNFNESYQKAHKTQGYIRNRASNEYYWSITDDGTTITVTIDGVDY